MAEQAPRRLTLTVTPALAGEKIDTLLRRELHLSGTVIRRIKWLEDGILLDGVRAITGQRVEAGQVLSVRVADPDHKGIMVPAPGPLDIVYEDGDLLVLTRPPASPSTPAPATTPIPCAISSRTTTGSGASPPTSTRYSGWIGAPPA